MNSELNDDSGSLEAKLQRFRALTISHPLLDSATRELTHFIMESPANGLLLFVGPTGSGKTTAALQIHREFNEKGNAQKDNKGAPPLLYGAVAASETDEPNWLQFYQEFLREAKTTTQGLRGLNEHRDMYEQMLQSRSVLGVFIDEAQHLFETADGRSGMDAFEVLQSLADRSKTRHVLFSTEQLLGRAHMNARFGRRVHYLHLPRCKADRNFVHVIRTLQNYLPLPPERDLLEEFQFVYDRSLGCVGLLKAWLYKASVAAARNRESGISMELLDRTALSPAIRKRMLEEIVNGERLWEALTRR